MCLKLLKSLIYWIEMNKAILVTGGAGYIGSHAAFLLSKLGYKVVIIDDLLHGQSFDHRWATFIKGDFTDLNILQEVFDRFSVDAVMHFAAFIEVGQSVKEPQRFYENNVVKTLKLLDFMLRRNVKKFIFSSSCAVYGDPVKIPMDENHPFAPISPYGKNKLAVEFALQDYSHAYGLQYVSLRYFNASGSLPEENLGEQHNPETHIIPLMLRAIKNQKPFKIFGNDYKTCDGSCVRDYIHVLDIANAHILALKHLDKNNKSDYFNLGSGMGFTVKQMIAAAEKVCNAKMVIQNCEHRQGDVNVLIADSTKINKVLGWQPQYSDLDFILKTAWMWEQKLIRKKKFIYRQDFI